MRDGVKRQPKGGQKMLPEMWDSASRQVDDIVKVAGGRQTRLAKDRGGWHKQKRPKPSKKWVKLNCG